MTVGSLKDLGFTVNMELADDFSVPNERRMLRRATEPKSEDKEPSSEEEESKSEEETYGDDTLHFDYIVTDDNANPISISNEP